VVKDRSITAGDCFLTMLYVFASGLLCNLLVSATLPITSSTKSNGTASLVMLFAIAYFSLAGYQHSPANSFFF
jgi:formate transporter